jgi:hypothetical protein
MFYGMDELERATIAEREREIRRIQGRQPTSRAAITRGLVRATARAASSLAARISNRRRGPSTAGNC